MRLHRSCEAQLADRDAEIAQLTADLTAAREALATRLLPVETAFQLGREFGQREGEARAARRPGLRLVAG